MDPDDNTKPILKDKMNLALLLYPGFLGVTNSRGSWVVGRGCKVVGCGCKVGCPPSSVRF